MTVDLTKVFLWASATSTWISLLYSVLPKVETFYRYPRFQAGYATFLDVLKNLGANLRKLIHPQIDTAGGSQISEAAASGQNPDPKPLP